MSGSLKNNTILELEIRSMLIQPLRDFVMELELDSPDKFSPQQQLQVYLYLLDPETSSLEVGSPCFNLYADFLKTKYRFDICDSEITQIKYFLKHEIDMPACADINEVLSRVVYNRCLDLALDQLQKNGINRDQFAVKFKELPLQQVIDIDAHSSLLKEQMNLRSSKARKLSRNFASLLSSKFKENNLVFVHNSYSIDATHIKKALITAINKEIIKITSEEAERIDEIDMAKSQLNKDFLSFCTSKEVKAKHTKKVIQWWKNKTSKKPMANDVSLLGNLRTNPTPLPLVQRRPPLPWWQRYSLCLCKRRQYPENYARLN